MRLCYFLVFLFFIYNNLLTAQNDLNLDFENVTRDGNAPIGWVSSGTHIGFLDEKIKKHGANGLRLEMSGDGDERSFSYYSNKVNLADYIGKEIIFRGYMKTENLTGSAGLYVHLQGGTYFNLETVNLDNMEGRRLKGTNDWTPIILRIPYHPNLYQLEFGVYIEGKGKVWVDDLKLLIDNKPHYFAEKRQANSQELYPKDANIKHSNDNQILPKTKKRAKDVIEKRDAANSIQKTKVTNN